MLDATDPIFVSPIWYEIVRVVLTQHDRNDHGMVQSRSHSSRSTSLLRQKRHSYCRRPTRVACESERKNGKEQRCCTPTYSSGKEPFGRIDYGENIKDRARLGIVGFSAGRFLQGVGLPRHSGSMEQAESCRAQPAGSVAGTEQQVAPRNIKRTSAPSGTLGFFIIFFSFFAFSLAL